MRIFKAPGKKQTPCLHGKGGIGKFFNKIFNAAYEPLNWAKKLKLKITPIKVAPKTSLKGGRRSKRRFLQTRKENWWVRAHRRKAYRRGGPYRLRRRK